MGKTVVNVPAPLYCIFLRKPIFLETWSPSGVWRGVKSGGLPYRVKPPLYKGIYIGAGTAELGDPYIRGGAINTRLGDPYRGPFEGASHMRYLEGSQTAEQNLLRV
jgi:hypothetical protein